MLSFQIVVLILFMHVSFWFSITRFLMCSRESLASYTPNIGTCVALAVVSSCGHIAAHLYIKGILS